jgi:hypothetical protein
MPALAAPASLHFTATRETGGTAETFPMGARLPAGPIRFDARTTGVADGGESLVRLSLLRDGRAVLTTDGPVLSHREENGQGVWRIEATLAHRPDVPWLLSNPVVVGFPRSSPPPERVDADAAIDLSAGTWVVENVVEGAGQRFTYSLAGGPPSGQYAAAVRATDNADAWDRVAITARASAPSRVWVQLRLTDSASGQRWGRSIYLDASPRTYRLTIRDFDPLEPRPSGLRPHVAQVRAVLLVADTVNTRPGAAGIIERIGLERTAPR